MQFYNFKTVLRSSRNFYDLSFFPFVIRIVKKYRIFHGRYSTLHTKPSSTTNRLVQFRSGPVQPLTLFTWKVFAQCCYYSRETSGICIPLIVRTHSLWLRTRGEIRAFCENEQIPPERHRETRPMTNLIAPQRSVMSRFVYLARTHSHGIQSHHIELLNILYFIEELST